jgi:hypothetical protein
VQLSQRLDNRRPTQFAEDMEEKMPKYQEGAGSWQVQEQLSQSLDNRRPTRFSEEMEEQIRNWL